MEEFKPNLFTKIILLGGVDATSLLGSTVDLEVDQTFTIGKSVAVLANENVIGHLDDLSTNVVWRFLHAGEKLTADVYRNLGNFQNESWFCITTHSFEIGCRVRFPNLTRDDGKLLLAHIHGDKQGKPLNSFPGVAPCNCPEELWSLIHPVKDENGISPLILSPFMI